MSRRSRRTLLIILPAAALALAVAGWLFRPQPPETTITRANVQKVKKGMSRAEVEALLGGPPRDEADGSRWVVWLGGRHPEADFVRWVGPEAAAGARFDGEDIVLVADTGVVVVPHRSYLDMLRRLLGR